MKRPSINQSTIALGFHRQCVRVSSVSCALLETSSFLYKGGDGSSVYLKRFVEMWMSDLSPRSQSLCCVQSEAVSAT